MSHIVTVPARLPSRGLDPHLLGLAHDEMDEQQHCNYNVENRSRLVRVEARSGVAAHAAHAAHAAQSGKLASLKPRPPDHWRHAESQLPRADTAAPSLRQRRFTFPFPTFLSCMHTCIHTCSYTHSSVWTLTYFCLLPISSASQLN